MIMLDNWAQECAKPNFFAISKYIDFQQGNVIWASNRDSLIVCPNFFVVT